MYTNTQQTICPITQPLKRTPRAEGSRTPTLAAKLSQGHQRHAPSTTYGSLLDNPPPQMLVKLTRVGHNDVEKQALAVLVLAVVARADDPMQPPGEVVSMANTLEHVFKPSVRVYCCSTYYKAVNRSTKSRSHGRRCRLSRSRTRRPSARASQYRCFPRRGVKGSHGSGHRNRTPFSFLPSVWADPWRSSSHLRPLSQVFEVAGWAPQHC
jgi:hypothetical protein